MIRLNVNGQIHAIDVESHTPLLRVLRERLGLDGAKPRCTDASCSACIVQVDGRAQRACAIDVAELVGARIVTVEGLAASEGLAAGELHAVQKTWIDERVPPCSCQSGLIVAAAALLQHNASPSEAEVDAALGACRCAAYPCARRAVLSLAERVNAW
ncbi:2Fe-2S iron-sulfur cluster-binding protein [Dokdonella sp.]|uniref:(2Fe-2S)-binding protein n=1 Tax=Dokdonella sp. TaxID=2291710 RepID=UPI001AFFBA32|nr:2Fe-2S iron-sulfur cluster-binding protein [Dokdonella sp.]MBO9661922.1 (2Fe-2S)-binding protein [Dokdonella sp.]